jgi:hypothetical protein
MALHRVRILLGIDWEDFPTAVIAVKNIQAKMVENASTFVSPNPSMAVFGQQCVDFGLAHEAVVTTKAKGASAIRLAKRDLVRASAESERAYVQFLCDGSPSNATSYATAAGMVVWTPGKHNRDVLEAVLVPGLPGVVSLKAAASLLVAPGAGTSRQRTYLWRHTLDGSKTFVVDEATPVCRTTVSGLPLNTFVGFQVAVKDAVGASDWCQAVTVYVH